jgi:hypothetical protein
MPYLLYERTKSNHKNIIGLFEQKSQAEIYKKMHLSKNSSSNLVITKLKFMDESPEIAKFIFEK